LLLLSENAQMVVCTSLGVPVVVLDLDFECLAASSSEKGSTMVTGYSPRWSKLTVALAPSGPVCSRMQISVMKPVSEIPALSATQQLPMGAIS
jgi:hypothetical protein